MSDLRQSLPSETGASVLKMLSESGVKVSSSTPVGPWVLVPYTENPAYVLRKRPFDQLKVLLNLNENSGSANQNKRAALWGLGGTGWVLSLIYLDLSRWLLNRIQKNSNCYSLCILASRARAGDLNILGPCL